MRNEKAIPSIFIQEAPELLGSAILGIVSEKSPEDYLGTRNPREET